MNRPEELTKTTTREQRQSLMAMYGLAPMRVAVDVGVSVFTVQKVLSLRPAPECQPRVREYILARLPIRWTEENFFAAPDKAEEVAA